MAQLLFIFYFCTVQASACSLYLSNCRSPRIPIYMYLGKLLILFPCRPLL